MSPPKEDDNTCQEENAKDYFIIQSIHEIKQLQRDMNNKMESLVSTFSSHTLEDQKNLGDINVSLSKLEEKDKTILKGASLLWGALVSGIVAAGAQLIAHFLKKS